MAYSICQFVAADAFDSPSALEVVWPRLVASYAVDAEAAKEQKAKPFTTKAAEVLLEHIANQHAEAFKSVGCHRAGQDRPLVGGSKSITENGAFIPQSFSLGQAVFRFFDDFAVFFVFSAPPSFAARSFNR